MGGRRFLSQGTLVGEASPEELERYRTTLRRNQTWLRRFLADPQRKEDELHLLVAARLRVLLHDGSDGPALLDYARLVGEADNLLVCGPHEPRDPTLLWPPYLISWNPADLWPDRKKEYCLPIEEYLRGRIGNWKIKFSEKPWQVETFTPADLIDWVASKEAVHHLPTESEEVRGVRRNIVLLPMRNLPQKAVEKLREDELSEWIFGLGEWTLHAIEYLFEEPREPLE